MARGISNLISSIPGFVGYVIVIVVIAFFIAQYSLTEMDTFPTRAVLMTERLLHSPEGISWEDPLTQRVYPHIIDAEKLDEWNEADFGEHLFYGLDNGGYALSFTVSDDTYYYKEDDFKRWRPQAAIATLGGREESVVGETYAILLKRGDDLVPTTLTMEVVAQP